MMPLIGILFTYIAILYNFKNEANTTAVFHVGFFENWRGGNPSLLLMTTETHPVSFIVEAPGIGFYLNGTVIAGGKAVVNFTHDIEMSISTNGNKGIYVWTSSNKVTLIGQSVPDEPDLSSTGTFFVLPFIGSCDNVYVYYRMSVSSNSLFSTVMLVGIENDTTVTVMTAQDSILKAEGVLTNILRNTEFSFSLDELKTAFIGSILSTDSNVSGIKVVTNKPLSAFSGHECALLPEEAGGCDYLIEQIPPTSLWGRVYYTAPLATRRSYTIKVLAAYNFTVVDIYCNNSKESNTFNEGVIIKRTYSYQEHCAIYSNKEVFVAQFSHGQNDDNVTGDPMMTTIPAAIHYTNKFIFSTINDANYASFVNIIVLAQYYQPDMMYLISGGVNKSLDTQEWVPVKVNNVIEAYATKVTISEGVVEVIHTNTSALMTTIVYGFARYKGYGHPGGFYFQKLHDSTVSLPSVDLTAVSPKMLGQPLTLECTAIAPECVTTTVKFVWSNGGVNLRQIEGTGFCIRYSNSSVCKDTYNISALSTNDEGRIYQCYIIINTSPPVMATSTITLKLNVPNPVISTYARGPIETTMVGFTQLIGCRATTHKGVELNAVQFSWTGPTGNTITNTSRMTIFPPYQHLNNFSSELLFKYLREGDQGVYTCTVVILNARASGSFNIDPLPIQRPQVTIVPLGAQNAGQPLALACYVVVSKGIVSSVDITWSRDGTILSRTIGAVRVNLLYTSYYNISLLTTNDTGKVYECDVVINSTPPVTHNDTFELQVDVPQVPLSISQPYRRPVSGQLYNLTCRATLLGVSSSLVMLNWTEQNSLSEYVDIRQSSRVILSDLTTNGSQIMRTVTFLPLLRSDARDYLCTVIVLGYINAYNIYRVVVGVDAPTVTASISPTLFTGDSGEDAVELLCTVAVMEDIVEALYQFTWMKNGNSLDILSNRIQITNSDDALSSSLYIDAADSNALLNNGVYTCDVIVTIAEVDSFVYSSGQSMVSLRVYSNLRAVNITSTNVVFRWDAPTLGVVRQYNITCIYVGYKSTVIIPGTHTIGTVTRLTPFTTYDCSIVIYARSITSGIMGNSVVVRTNEAASSPPIITSVIAADTYSVRVNWMIPNRVNGVLSFYSITYVTDNGIKKKININFNGQPTQSYIITGLSHPYQLVTVTINATNGGGTSNSSNVVTGRTAEAVPGVVLIYNTIGLPNGTSTVMVWYQPKQPNGIIIGYQLIYSVYNDSTETMTSDILASTARKHTIQNLTPGVPYQVQVVAFTSAGRGALNDYVIFFSKELDPLKSPENVTFVQIDHTSINITWTPLSFFEARGFPCYTVALFIGKKQSDKIIKTSDAFAVLQHLQAGTEYTVVVSVANNGSTAIQSSSVIVPKAVADGEGQSVGGALIGGVVGGILFIAIMVVIVSLFVCYRSRKRESFQFASVKMKDSSSSNDHTSKKKSGILLDTMDEEF
ncbi:cell adhesion molecule DSCAML1-like isoform X2 [Dysidea avara]|uniref:cell adhesion molecule DSCAML1-like isoform X2 n=1 Tax=Dysidea avara TaxID=196820 RepID=UPI00332B08C4